MDPLGYHAKTLTMECRALCKYPLPHTAHSCSKCRAAERLVGSSIFPVQQLRRDNPDLSASEPNSCLSCHLPCRISKCERRRDPSEGSIRRADALRILYRLSAENRQVTRTVVCLRSQPRSPVSDIPQPHHQWPTVHKGLGAVNADGKTIYCIPETF